ncbi:DNA cytosine methyltransferase [Qipengyuania sp.]|uniref:DNA cytosine methyltransferase n=1 Tax=Qipengyuania sp. TaxID=2004515 RepID=UPI0037368ADA
MRFVDLFSGAGLFSGGFVQQGFRPVLAIDLCKDAIASYERNVAPVGRYGSVADLERLPDCEVLIAGPPCQGFSTLGRRDPLDARNALAFEVVRLAATNPPNVVVIENVPPFLRSTAWARIKGALEELDYFVVAWELDAADYGTPQYRKRSFTIASRVGIPEGPEPTLGTISAKTALSRPIDPDDPMHRWPLPSDLAAARMSRIPSGGDKRDLMRSAPDLCPPSWKSVGCQATDVWGRIDADKPANTLRCAFQNPSKGRYIHPMANRVISLREGARLQGVPDDWQFVGRNYPVARQIGNGVPIPLAGAVAGSIRTLLTQKIRATA